LEANFDQIEAEGIASLPASMASTENMREVKRKLENRWTGFAAIRRAGEDSEN